MNYQYILFDLDGTLTDPKAGITKSVAYALEAFGIQTENTDDLCPFIGPPLKESFMVYYNMSSDEAEQAIAKYRERFAPIGIYENEVYSGIPQMLEKLKGQGKTIILATSKPAVYSIEILKHFDLYKYFSFVSGSELDGTRVNKDEVIAYALERAGVADKSQAVMIGDRKHDILGAKKVGVASIGVLYGYGDRPELERAGADQIAQSVTELGALLGI